MPYLNRNRGKTVTPICTNGATRTVGWAYATFLTSQRQPGSTITASHPCQQPAWQLLQSQHRNLEHQQQTFISLVKLISRSAGEQHEPPPKASLPPPTPPARSDHSLVISDHKRSQRREMIDASAKLVPSRTLLDCSTLSFSKRLVLSALFPILCRSHTKWRSPPR